VQYDGRTLTPGEVFRPLADHPDYEVLFVGLVGTTATFADGWGAWSEDLKEDGT
jgi:hypothetical protein